jgi:hypothetical protein
MRITGSSNTTLRNGTGVAILFLVLLASTPLGAQEIAHSQFIPILARSEGVGGTQWVTDLTVYNTTDSELVVGYQFLLADQANIFDPAFPNRFTLAPRETKIYEDVVNSLVGLEDGQGSLLITVDSARIPGNPSGAEILSTTRIYNTGSAEGTYGQTVPALSVTINAAGTTSVATGARNDSSFRSNLGVASLALLAEITVHYRVRNATGATLAEGMKTMAPSSVSQWSFSSLGVPTTEGPLTVELWLDPDDVLPDACATLFPNMFIAYVSKVDNGTGDAEYIYAAPNDPYECGK